MNDGRYAHQRPLEDPELVAWLLLESQILRETKDDAAVIDEFPNYRERLRRAHGKLRTQRREQLARDEQTSRR